MKSEVETIRISAKIIRVSKKGARLIRIYEGKKFADVWFPPWEVEKETSILTEQKLRDEIDHVIGFSGAALKRAQYTQWQIKQGLVG